MKHLSYFIVAMLIVGCANLQKVPTQKKSIPCYKLAANQFTKWSYIKGKFSQGLYNRRKKEAELFLKGCKDK